MDPCQTHRGEVTCLRPPAIKRGDGIQFEALDSETTPSSDTILYFIREETEAVRGSYSGYGKS